MAAITITETITKGLKDLSKRLEDMTPAFKRIADYEWASTKLRYKEALDPDMKEWPDPITIRRGAGPESGSGKRTKRTGWSQADAWKYSVAARFHATAPGYHFFDPFKDRPMIDTGSLFASIGRAYGKDYAIVGTNKEYATKLQNGRFPFLGVNDKTVDNVKKVAKFYLMGAKK